MELTKLFSDCEEDSQLKAPAYCPILISYSDEHLNYGEVDGEDREQFQHEEDYNLWFEDYS